MKKLKAKFTRPVCLILALLVMAGSMAAAALTGSPYDTLKDAAFSLLTAESAALSFSGTLTVDGEVYQSGSEYTEYSRDAKLSYSNSYYGKGSYPGEDRLDYRSENKSYYSEHLNIYQNSNSLGMNDNTYRAYYNQHSYGYNGTNSNAMLSGYNRSDMEVRLVELCADLLMGDLKNNIGMTNSNGVKVLAATLTAQQIPELFNALATVAASQSVSSYQFIDYSASADGSTATQIFINQNHEKVTQVFRYSGKTYCDPETGMVFEDQNDPRRDEGCYNWNTTELVSETKTPAMKEDYGEDKLKHPIEKIAIDYVSGTAHLDKDNQLIDGMMTVRVYVTSIFGEETEVEATVNVECENLNHTTPRCFATDAADVLTEELFQEHNFSGVAFTLNADGTINRDSLVWDDDTVMPGAAKIEDTIKDAMITLEDAMATLDLAKGHRTIK